mmetsp:Transcript_6691/g.11721  ORF Transcript_6691/g.11721 Transcript_6691/m.11721 type:complete len:321 (-) Transcript_6691:111-1073(-)
MVVRDPDTTSTRGASGECQATSEVPRILDEDAFPRSRDFLRASQEYASSSGCRFRGEDFRGICDDLLASEAPSPSARRDMTSSTALLQDGKKQVPLIGAARSRDAGPLLTVKLQLADALREYAARLRSADKGLEEELDRALRTVLAESARNAMIAQFQALELWPPAPPPAIDEEDCAYQDVSAPLPVVAQRLYNDQVRRLCDSTGVLSGLEARARTASFLIDFAQAIGMPLPETSNTHADLMKELAASVSEWEQQQQKEWRASCGEQDEQDVKRLGTQEHVQNWFNNNGTAILGATAGALTVAAAVASTAAIVHKSARQR